MIKIDVDSRGALKALDLAQKQVRYAAAVALTRTAKAVEKRLQGEIASTLDNPTPWIRKGTYTKPATKQALVAEVGIRDRQARYLREHFSGRARGQKPFEQALAGKGILPSGHKAIPGAGLKLDAHGNPSRTQLKEIFGALKSGMNLAKGRGKKMQLVGYFVLPPGNRAGIAPGVYYRAGRKILPVLIFVPAARYRKRMDLEQMASQVAAREFDAQFQAAFAQALGSAR